MSSFIHKKIGKRILFVLLAVGIVAGLAAYANAQVEWPTKIDHFEQGNPAITETVAYGTQKVDLNLPKTLRVVIPLDGSQWDPGTFVQAEPGADAGTKADVETNVGTKAKANTKTAADTKAGADAKADAGAKADADAKASQNDYGYITPENAGELFAAGKKVIYTFSSPEGNGDGRISYRVYGSINGSENVWFACDEAGDINGVVRDIPITWENAGYHPDKPGKYTFTANMEGYTASGSTPTAEVVVNEDKEGAGGKPLDNAVGGNVGGGPSDNRDTPVSYGSPNYIGNIRVRQLNLAPENAWRKPTAVTQLPGYRVAGKIDDKANSDTVPPLPAGAVLAHCKYSSALLVNRIYYDVEVLSKLDADVNSKFQYGLTLNDDNTEVGSYLRSFIGGSASVADGAPVIDVTLSFYYAGTDTKAVIPSLAYGNTCWADYELFNFEDAGYYLYSQIPSIYAYNTTYGAWHPASGVTWTPLWSNFTNRSDISIQQYNNINGSKASGLEVTLGRCRDTQSTSVSVQKDVIDPSKTFQGSKDFTFYAQPCNSDGVVTGSADHVLTTPAKSQNFKTGSTTVSGFGNDLFNVAGTYYNLITENGSPEDNNWIYDNTRYLQTIVVSQDKETLALSQKVTYKNLTAGAAVARPTFTNTFCGPASTSVSVRKNITDNSVDGSFTSGSFTFKVQCCNVNGALILDHAVGTPTKTQSCTTGTTVSGFGTCTFASPGTYYNLITEMPGSGDGWAYDRTRYIQTIVVAKDGATGKLGAAVTYRNPDTGAAADMPTFTNTYYGTKAAIQVKKVVSNHDSSMAGQPFMVSLLNGVTAQVPLKNGETSRQILPELTGARTFDITEAVPMEYDLTDITLTNSGKGTPAKLTLTKAADGTVTGGKVTIYPGNKILLTVTNRFTHKGYFKGRGDAENTFSR